VAYFSQIHIFPFEVNSLEKGVEGHDHLHHGYLRNGHGVVAWGQFYPVVRPEKGQKFFYQPVFREKCHRLKTIR